jgi:hypothetical protein
MSVDKIIDSAKSDADLIEKLVSYNKKIHGDDLVNKAIDMADSEESLQAALVAMGRQPRRTKEGDSFLMQIFKGIENLGYISKPLDYIFTPFTEGIRGLPRAITELRGDVPQTPPIDTTAPYTQGLNISDRFGLKNLITDISNAMGIKQGALFKPGDDLKKEYPVLSAVAEELSNPAALSAMLLEAPLMGKVPLANIPEEKIRKFVTNKYLEAIQREPKLAQTLKESGKWNDVVDYVSNNFDKLVRIRPWKRDEALDYLTGPVQTIENYGGYTRSKRMTDAGVIGEKSKAMKPIEDKMAKVGYDIAPIESNALAQSILDDSLLESQKNRASEIINQEIPVLKPSQSKIEKLKKVDLYPKESAQLSEKTALAISEIEDMLQKRKAKKAISISGISPEIPNPAYREDLQWLSTLPVVESDSVFPKIRNEYVTDIQTPVDPTYGRNLKNGLIDSQITTVDEYFRTAQPTVGQNQKLLDIAQGKQLEPKTIPNQEYINLKKSIDDELLLINSEIEKVKNLDIDTVSKYKNLQELQDQRNALDKFYFENFDESLLPFGPGTQEDSYRNMVYQRDIKGPSYATSLRKRGNQLIEGVKLGQDAIDAGAQQAAGMAIRGAGNLDEQNILGMIDSADADLFTQLKREQELALNARDLIDRNRLVPGSMGSMVPVGDLTRGIGREILSTLPEFGYPAAYKGVKAINSLIPQTITPIIPYSAEASRIVQQGRQPQSIITADTVAQYEIPRDTARIMNEQDMVMAKLQMEVKDPQILGMASKLFSGLQRNPESVKPMVAQLANMFPQIFEKDKYNRFDGKVDPSIVPIAIEDIRKSQMPTIEKASKIESLYNTGLLVD